MKHLKILLLILLATNFSTLAFGQSFERVCIQKEIDDDNVIAEIRGGLYHLKKWSLRFSPLVFEGKCFDAKISGSSLEMYFENKSPIKWDIEKRLSGSGTGRSGTTDCYQSTIVKPSPFLGNGGETIKLADGTLWKEVSYQYLYLYTYSPTVYICPSSGKLIVDSHTLQVVRVK